jgi:hypothetical protein
MTIARYAPLRAEIVARAALRRGPMTRESGAGGGSHWRFDRRLFNATTINRLVKSGEAIIEGNVVRGVSR